MVEEWIAQYIAKENIQSYVWQDNTRHRILSQWGKDRFFVMSLSYSSEIPYWDWWVTVWVELHCWQLSTFFSFEKELNQFLVCLADFSDGAAVQNVLANAGDASDLGSIPGLGRSPRVGNGNPFQYYCL